MLFKNNLPHNSCSTHCDFLKYEMVLGCLQWVVAHDLSRELWYIFMYLRDNFWVFLCEFWIIRLSVAALWFFVLNKFNNAELFVSKIFFRILFERFNLLMSKNSNKFSFLSHKRNFVCAKNCPQNCKWISDRIKRVIVKG